MTPLALELRRTIQAPPQRVFDAWTQPELLVRWWRCKPEWSTPTAEVDLRPGGQYRLGMHEPGKPEPWVCHGEYREIDPPRKLVFTWSWLPPAHQVGVTLVTVEFRDLGGATEVVLRHEGLPSPALVEEHTQGWTLVLATLAGALA